MAKFNRRQLLRLGLSTGIGVTTAPLARAVQNYRSDPSQAVVLPPAQRWLMAQSADVTDYDRQISGLLVRCCDLATEQYQKSEEDKNYHGSIQDLTEYAEYAPWLQEYTQIASFQATELDFSAAPTSYFAQTPFAQTPKSQTVALSLKPVFFGYALASPTSQIIALRGTQTELDWISNLVARQVNFSSQEPQYGKVHEGFQFVCAKILPQIRQVLEQFDPTLPCYLTGHSLGGVLAVLTAAHLALDYLASENSAVQPQVLVYTYGSPKAGDAAFAQMYNRWMPHTFRIVNSADLIPTIPPESFDRQPFVHVGQAWNFRSADNITRSHAISTYRNAVDQGLESLIQ